MGLDFAIDALYQTGWSDDASLTAKKYADGRPYPTSDSIAFAFAAAGYDLSVRHIQLFDCYRAEWRDMQGQAMGAVVGQSAEEAAVYALSQLRRQMATVEA